MVRSALVGVIGGAIPGIGGIAAAFYAYGMATQATNGADRHRFGKGEIKGVIAPESTNNASAGGELVPLLAFGVPGGATSAVLLVGFEWGFTVAALAFYRIEARLGWIPAICIAVVCGGFFFVAAHVLNIPLYDGVVPDLIRQRRVSRAVPPR